MAANTPVNLPALKTAAIAYCEKQLAENKDFINLINFAALTPECIKGAKLLPHEESLLKEGKETFKYIKQTMKQLKSMTDTDPKIEKVIKELYAIMSINSETPIEIKQEQIQEISVKIRLFTASQTAVRTSFNANAQSAAKVPPSPTNEPPTTGKDDFSGKQS